MDQILLWLLAVAAFIGGIDCLMDNRLGLGERFEEGFRLLGPTALSMAGILCFSPLIAELLSYTVASFWKAVGLDPAMIGALLPIDMGGYQTAISLASDSAIGLYAGVIISSTLGCTVAFTIPMGFGLLNTEDIPAFSNGILIGLSSMPIAQCKIIGGIASGISLLSVLHESIPCMLFSVILILCLRFAPNITLRIFSHFSHLVRFLSIAGLTIGAVQYIGNLKIIQTMMPLDEAMQTVSSIGIAMLGSLPAAELLRRCLSKPLHSIGTKLKMSDHSFAGLLIGFVSATPALSMIKEMDNRGKIMNAAFLVCGASTLAAHLGFAVAVARNMVFPLLLTKLIGGLLGVLLTLFLTRKNN